METIQFKDTYKMPKTKNTEPNFGITLDDMKCFRARPPAAPNQNKEALGFIRDGIDLFEIPREHLGMPLKLLEKQISVDILAGYLGLGHLLLRGEIPTKKQGDVGYDQLLNQDPHEIIKAFIEFGFNYNGIRRFKKKGFTDLKGKYADRIKALPQKVKDRFMHSLMQAEGTKYAVPPLDSSTPLVHNLIAEVYADKHGDDFSAETKTYRMRRLKVRSESPGREGSLYIVRNYLLNNGNEQYSCTCPDFRFKPKNEKKDCKHIKEMKNK